MVPVIRHSLKYNFMNQIFTYRFEELFNILPDGALVIDPVGNISLANQVAAQLLGYPDSQSLTGKPVHKLYVNPNDHDSLLSILGYRGVVEKNIFEWKKKTGETVLVELTASPLRDENGHINGILGFFRDMTAKLENQLAQQATLEATAARTMDEDRFLDSVNFYQSMPMTLILQGIAHNFNTPFGSIRGRAELLKHQLEKNESLFRNPEPDQKAALLQLHAKQTKGLADIIQQVDKLVELTKGFSQRLTSEYDNPETGVDLNEVIRNLILFLDSSLYFKHRILKQTEFDYALPPVDIPYRTVSLTLYHLLIHSMKATAGLNQKKLWIKTGHDDQFVWIDMTDNRERMDDEQMSDLFSIRYSSRYPAPDEARFSLCDLEIVNVKYLLSSYHAELEIVSEDTTTFRIRIERVRTA